MAKEKASAWEWLLWAGVHGFSSVALGAFAAHGLKQRLDPEALGWVETGARYQMYCALSLLALVTLEKRLAPKILNLSGWGFALGGFIFSGSLYVMALGAPRWFGAITPLGGLGMLLAWGAIAWGSLKGRG